MGPAATFSLCPYLGQKPKAPTLVAPWPVERDLQFKYFLLVTDMLIISLTWPSMVLYLGILLHMPSAADRD